MPATDHGGELVVIDGSSGEGGGQILRSSLALSLVTGRPVRIENVRSKREKPGLQRQHLVGVLAAAAVGAAIVDGAELGSREVTFRPRGIRGGTYRHDIGSAGSTTLVAQTVLPALLCADAPSTLHLTGGTHNPMAPTFDFLERAFLPVLRRMGAVVDAKLLRHGFHPAGGGEIEIAVRPAALEPLELVERGAVRTVTAVARVADLPESIASREAAVLREKLDLSAEQVRSEVVAGGPGNVVVINVATEACTEVFTALGRIRKSAERVAADAVRECKAFLRHDVPVGPHLADQLLLPMALARGGRFRTTLPTMHSRTNARVIETFLPVRIEITDEGSGIWLVTVAAW